MSSLRITMPVFDPPLRQRSTAESRWEPPMIWRGDDARPETLRWGMFSRWPLSPTGRSRLRARAARALAIALCCALFGGLACSGEPGERAQVVERAPAPTPSTQPHQDPFAEHDLEALRPRPRLAWPTVIPHITSTFGWRTNPITGAGSKLHRGLDLRGQTGDPVLSIGDGTIQFAGHDPFLGTCVIVDHGGGLTSWYGHLSDLLVYEGMVVERGAAIGLVGTTGRSQAPHLHLSIKIGETSVDPLFVLGAPAYAYPALLEPPAEDAAPAQRDAS